MSSRLSIFFRVEGLFDPYLLCYLRRMTRRDRKKAVGALIFCSAVSLVALAQFSWTQSEPRDGAQRYYVAFLRPDPERKTLAPDEADKLQAAHMANIHKMADDGMLVSAGPFDDTPRTISGIFIFKVDSLEKAQSIAMKDPTVVAHRNTIDVHAWDGPAGIGDEYRRLHQLDPKTPENMQIHPFCMLFRGDAWGRMHNREAVLADHRSYVGKLRAEGKLSAAGPVQGEDELFGLVVFRAVSMDEAKELMGEDPAVRAGVLRVEYHQWWSSDHVLPW